MSPLVRSVLSLESSSFQANKHKPAQAQRRTYPNETRTVSNPYPCYPGLSSPNPGSLVLLIYNPGQTQILTHRPSPAVCGVVQWRSWAGEVGGWGRVGGAIAVFSLAGEHRTVCCFLSPRDCTLISKLFCLTYSGMNSPKIVEEEESSPALLPPWPAPPGSFCSCKSLDSSLPSAQGEREDLEGGAEEGVNPHTSKMRASIQLQKREQGTRTALV